MHGNADHTDQRGGVNGNRPLAFTLGFEQTVAGRSDAAGKPPRVGELSARGIIFKLILQGRRACGGVGASNPPIRW